MPRLKIPFRGLGGSASFDLAARVRDDAEAATCEAPHGRRRPAPMMCRAGTTPAVLRSGTAFIEFSILTVAGGAAVASNVFVCWSLSVLF